jgi:hypothetical protein
LQKQVLLLPATVVPLGMDNLDHRHPFEDSRTAETPEESTICLMLVPPFPMIIPQHGTGTRIRTTNENPGMTEECRVSDMP